MRTMALVVRFGLELALVGGAAWGVWQLSGDGWRWVAAPLAAVAIMGLWGVLLSPRAAVAAPDVLRLAVEAALFAGTGLLLVSAGAAGAGAALVVVWLADRVALRLTAGRPSALEPDGVPGDRPRLSGPRPGPR
ncbi:YrdB family protein [Myceligenerans indicum]|uniref:YrdB family protein n=1 Tax=Myceligenerans indicum TaxID=2593663 RepID=A0ABS1LRK9_9MICO|nr:YrdB family protein [Myceligenerans indicum]MBL0888869.1 YrdB family protein [Myceligenerans indicum]